MFQGGFYLLNLIDVYAGGFPLIIVGIGELVAINWVYGYNRFNEDIKLMSGKPAPFYFKIMLCVVSPAIMLVSEIRNHKSFQLNPISLLIMIVLHLFQAIFAFAIYQHQPLSFQDYVYPAKFTAIGWLTVVACVAPIPIFAIIVLFKNGCLKVCEQNYFRIIS